MSPLLRLTAAAALLALSCSSSPKPAPAAQPEDPAGPPLALMNATMIVKSCPDQTKTTSHQAETAIRQVIEPCTKVPGGAAHFTVTMMPGGRIEIGSPEGDPDEGVVPTCAVKNQLTHKIFLRKPCSFVVQLEERPMAQQPAAPSSAAPP
jgi:hypothetical protein